MQGFCTRAILLVGLLLSSACTPNDTPSSATGTPAPSPTAQTRAGGAVLPIAQAHSLHAPALLQRGDALWFAWADGGAQPHVALQAANAESPLLRLPARLPAAPTLHDMQGATLLLWLDETPQEAERRLQGLVIAADGQSRSTVTPLTNAPTSDYSALSLGDGLVRVVWRGGGDAVQSLFLQDVTDRAVGFHQRELRQNAAHPALLRDAQGTVHLFWLEQFGRQAYHAQFDDGASPPPLTNVQPLSALAALPPGDAVESFDVAADARFAYLFWRIRAADGTRRMVVSVGVLGSADYSPPQTLGIAVDASQTVDGGFALGTVQAAAAAESAPVPWALPLAGQHEVLPAAVRSDNRLGIALFRDGALFGYAPLVDTPPLLGAPALLRTDNGLALSWAEVPGTGAATLFYTQIAD